MRRRPGTSRAGSSATRSRRIFEYRHACRDRKAAARLGAASSFQQAIDTDRTGTSRGDEQEDEAEEDGRFPAVLDRPTSVRIMGEVVGNRHFTRCENRRRNGEKTNRD